MVWAKDAQAFRERVGVPLHFRPWTGREQFRGHGLVSSARIAEVLDLAAIAICRQQGLTMREMTPLAVRKVLRGAYIDVSQSVSRRAWAAAGQPLPTLTSSSVIYSFGADRVLLGRELCALHGFTSSLKLPASITDNDLRALVSNSMALPCVALVIWALMLTKQFPAPGVNC